MLSLFRASLAPPERTLIDILQATAQRYPQAPALDDGNTSLTYADLLSVVEATAARLNRAGIGRGDRVGVRRPSGTLGLYTAILGVLKAGAAYVPVDQDDPDERAELVFGEAGVSAVLTATDTLLRRGANRFTAAALSPREVQPPLPGDDAWIIFTSGSTGVPKGVAASHRSAAAFVDAEARLFAQDRPLGPGDRVLAGLSVAFDASCEEMWLAWRHGACLVPAPRALVRSGMDLAPWLVAQGVTVVSTVPTLASLWPSSALTSIRLLIFGGESCPPELADRLAEPGREVWNTYGPTEATVVACAARLGRGEPVRIGLPLDGWDLAVLGPDALPVAQGEVGELIIGGIGLARYLDPVRDADRYAPMPSLGWPRAYRSGDLVRHDGEGLVFVGRGDDQVKVAGRRIELGEIDNALLALDGVAAAATAVRATAAGNQLLIGYITPRVGVVLDEEALAATLRTRLPSPLVPRLAIVETIPTKTSGKADRDALPWPLRTVSSGDGSGHSLVGTALGLAGQWTRILGCEVTGGQDDFFSLGGGSLAAAQLVSALREHYPEVTVADVYDHPRIQDLADALDEFTIPEPVGERRVELVPRRAQLIQTLLGLPINTLVGLRWLTWLSILDLVLRAAHRAPWGPAPDPLWTALGWLALVTPVGRMALSALSARLLLRGLRPGTYPRGGSVHLRLWCAEAIAGALGAENLAGAPWMIYYARALGATIGAQVDLHTVPPVTGLMSLGRGVSVEPEVDLSGHWLDGDRLHIGRIKVEAGVTIGSRSTVAPGTRIGQDAEIAPGSAVSGSIPPGEFWSGSPASFSGIARRSWPPVRPAPATPWVIAYGLTAVVLASYPLLAALAGLWMFAPGPEKGSRPVGQAEPWTLIAVAPAVTLIAFVTYALLTMATIRMLGLGLSEGYHGVRSRVGWQVWATERLMDEARTLLFPLYASLITPWWLRCLGATIGNGVEASTVLMLPAMTSVGDDAFLADDTLIGSYELGGGWLRIERAKVGKRAFVGNSGMTAPGRKVPKDALVAVLSAAPLRAKKGTSWIGSPPVQMRRTIPQGDRSRTFAPARHLRWARAAVELCRLIPTAAAGTLIVGVMVTLALLELRFGPWGAAALSGVFVLLAGLSAASLSVIAKWLLVGRIAAGEHPLWSSFVWRNELADTFVEMLAAPWFAHSATGTPALSIWLRALGASIGRGVWCETYWLPEADLVRLGEGASVNRGTVVQTHLFHDRLMSLDDVVVEAGATLGPQSVVLPAAVIGHGATVGPASLVMRGEAVPPNSRWRGNPIAAWTQRRQDS